MIPGPTTAQDTRPEYVLRFRFRHLDDDHALRLATAMGGMMCAEWESNRVTWDGVERADSQPLATDSYPVDPVLVSAAWGGAARPIESDEDMEGVIERVLSALQGMHAPPEAGPDPDALRQTIATALRTALKERATPHLTDPFGRPIASSGFGLSEYDLADVALNAVQPYLDRLADAEAQRLTALGMADAYSRQLAEVDLRCDTAQAKILTVLELHNPTFCTTCRTPNCETRRALTAPPEPADQGGITTSRTISSAVHAEPDGEGP